MLAVHEKYLCMKLYISTMFPLLPQYFRLLAQDKQQEAWEWELGYGWELGELGWELVHILLLDRGLGLKEGFANSKFAQQNMLFLLDQCCEQMNSIQKHKNQ